MRTVLRYAGGKSRAFDKITPFIPKKTKEIVSPFIGGGSLEVRWSGDMGIKVFGFDIFHHLVNFWQVLLSDSKSLADELRELSPTKETYKKVKEKLLSWKKTQELFEGYKTDYYKRQSIELNRIKAAAYYYFNHNLSYGPGFLGWMSKTYQDKIKYKRMINRIESFKNEKMVVEQSSFENVILGHTKKFLYLDPPYYLSDENDNKMFKGMYPMANFAFHHEGFDHQKLRNLIYRHKGYFILSYNNCKTIRDWYSGYYQYFPSWFYSYGQGETRIGKNKTNNKPKESHEILITNIKVDRHNPFFT